VYRRPKFLEVLLNIREEMAREADYDIDLFVQMVRQGKRPNEPGPANNSKTAKGKPRKLKR
jgi:hypothetical protein